MHHHHIGKHILVSWFWCTVEYKWSVGDGVRAGWIKWGVRPRILMRTKVIIIIIIIMGTQHSTTMTKSHHGGEMSVIMKVGMCQCQKPTIHQTPQ